MVGERNTDLGVLFYCLSLSMAGELPELKSSLSSGTGRLFFLIQVHQVFRFCDKRLL
jgi:hypothetical protein